MRFLPHTDADRHAMLDRIGVDDMRALFNDIPAAFHIVPGSLKLPPALHEAGIIRKFTAAAEVNRHAGNTRCFLGGGTYHHFIPAVVDYVISRGEFLTAYTPYQPEISQGTLQALFEFQTMTARLLGMEVANASMYDAATAVAEAALMARRITRRQKVVLASGLNPRYRAVTRNYLSRLPGETITAPGTDTLATAVDGKTACIIVQNPDFYGTLHELAPVRAACDTVGALLVIAFSDATAFGLVRPPGDDGADIAVGSGQALGIPMAYGGPHIGLFATRQRHIRQMPGRVCGMTEDAEGRRGFVLTLSTREQHIRRARATSNICSNQGLMCTAVATYMALLGDTGLRAVAERSATALDRLVAGLPAGVKAARGAHYNETVLSFADKAARDRFLRNSETARIFAGIPLERLEPDAEPRHLLVATTEMIEATDIDEYLRLLEAAL